MTWLTIKDLDYLTARLHGRRSRMAEAERLDELCRIGHLSDFGHTIFPEAVFSGTLNLQRQLIQELIHDLSGLPTYLDSPGAHLLDWMLVRFQVEYLKVLVRAWITKAPIDEVQEHLLPLPKGLTLKTQALASAESPADFVGLLPGGPLRKSLTEALKTFGENPRPFFLEAALDRGYFRELFTRVKGVSGEDREIIGPMVHQEVDIFHLMLVMRGKFHYGLTPDLLLPFHVVGSRISRSLFATMLNSPDLHAVVDHLMGRVLDEFPSEDKSGETHGSVHTATVEHLAWKRFLRLANRAFRQSNMGLGAVVGYAGIRRVEVANLITISEGIGKDITGSVIRGRLISRTDLEAAHV